MEKQPQRKSPRAPWHRYGTGLYFITIVTKYRAHHFGEVINNKVVLSPLGSFVDQLLLKAEHHHIAVKIPRHIVMPNHVHFIIYVDDASTRELGPQNKESGKSTLARYINAFKGAVTRFAKRQNIDFEWQSRYHDHIIRGRDDRNSIEDYIINNPRQWSTDVYGQPLHNIPHRPQSGR